jgi:endonuclease VIII-like 1
MPEGPEIRIMADFITQIAAGKVFSQVEKSAIYKFDIPVVKNFGLSATSRGKELKLHFITKNKTRSTSMVMGLGMTGYWLYQKNHDLPKHTHLLFHYRDHVLAFNDARRFSHIRGTDFSPDRGPDPVTEYEDFVVHLLSSLDKKIFHQPLYLALMDQRYFNGIGNYARSEIIYRLRLNPFESLENIFIKYKSIFTQGIRDILNESYLIGGATLKDWKNPNSRDSLKDIQNFRKWLKCYQQPGMNKFIDKHGRTFWYDPQYTKI